MNLKLSISCTGNNLCELVTPYQYARYSFKDTSPKRVLRGEGGRVALLLHPGFPLHV